MGVYQFLCVIVCLKILLNTRRCTHGVGDRRRRSIGLVSADDRRRRSIDRRFD